MWRKILLIALLLLSSLSQAGWAATNKATPILKISTDKKVVAITFDDGPDPKYTPLLLEVLHQHNVRATFFVLGSQAEKYHNVITWMHKAGHEIGNHGYSHPKLADMTKMRRAEVYTEIKKTEKVIMNIVGVRPDCYRPPGGVVTPAILRAAFEAGYELIHWSIDPKDWKKNRTSEVIAGAVKNTIGAGDIILFHDGGVNQEETIKAMIDLITDLKEEGYKFVTVSELLEME